MSVFTVEANDPSGFICLFLPAMLSMVPFASRAAGNQQALHLAQGELSKAVQHNVLIDLRDTKLHTDTTKEAKELRGSFEQQQPGGTSKSLWFRSTKTIRSP